MRRKYLQKLVDTYENSAKNILPRGNFYYVDETNGADGNNGLDWANALATIQAGIDKCGEGDTVVIAPVEVADGDTDPGSYSENLVIGIDNAYTTLIGVPRGRCQGALPQLKIGATTTSPVLTIRAPGCVIKNLGINGSGGTGGGIMLDEATTSGQCWGLLIENCHFKNCVGTTATNAATGGAIQWKGSGGGAWQVQIKGNRFYKNVGDIVFPPGLAVIPQDIVIEDNIFSGPAANVDCNIYCGAGGVNGLIIKDNLFTCNPNISSGTNASFLVLTDCVGILANNCFAASTAEGGSEIKFGATQENLVPTTVFMANNYGEFSTGVGAGLVSGEIFRT